MAMDHIRLPSGISLGGALASVLIPGAGVYVCAPRLWGRIALGLAVVLVILNIVWFGSQLANLPFGLLLSLHASSLGFLIDKMLPVPQFRTRLITAAGLLIFLACGVYLPARNLVQDHWFLPLRLKNQVVIIHREAPGSTLRRGDVIAYSFGSVDGQGIIVHGGLGLGPVLALPGDSVRFTSTAFEVNGQPHARLALMPQSGEITISERHWFVWPDFDISGHGYVMDKVPETILSVGLISDRQFLGKPCRRWLWNRHS
jgi:hypothetical protein